MKAILRKAVGDVKNKGEKIGVVGASNSGKSTTLTAIAESSGVQELLGMREAHGKGTTISAEIVVTNHPQIPEEKLIIAGQLCKAARSDPNISDDNNLVGKVLYDSAKNSEETTDFARKVIKALKSNMKTPSNDSLAYKISGFVNTAEGNERFEEWAKSFRDDQIAAIRGAYNKANSIKGSDKVQLFTNDISSDSLLRSVIDAFWDIVETAINMDYNILFNLISVHAEGEIDEHGLFTVCLSEADKDSELSQKLLKSENGSMEYLMRDFTLIYRGQESLFKPDTSDQFTVAEVDGEDIKCIHLVDTKGLFHSEGAKASTEAERIVDILSQYHIGTLICVFNSYITNDEKHSKEAIDELVKSINRNIDIYCFHTHLDDYLRNYANSHSQPAKRTSRFGGCSSSTLIDWDKMYNAVDAEQNDSFNEINAAIKNSGLKRKPQLIKRYAIGLSIDPNNGVDQYLGSKGYTYDETLPKLFADINERMRAAGKKFKITNDLPEAVSLKADQPLQGLSILYQNLLECENTCDQFRLYSSTVRASVNKWLKAGNVHKASVATNNLGYKAITTIFVQQMRNIVMPLLNNVQFDTQFLTATFTAEETERFKEAFIEYLKETQTFGRIFAEQVGNESYSYGYKQEEGYKLQYKRFYDMLRFTRMSYFPSDKSVNIDNKPLSVQNKEPAKTLKEILERSFKICLEAFIDTKCIVTY